MQNLKLYSITDKYISYLRDNADEHVFANTDSGYIHSRKYLGAVLAINGYQYFVPLSSPKNTDYIYRNGVRQVRNSIIPIIRMIDRDKDGRETLLGTLKFSNMLPVPKSELALYDLDGEKDTAYKNLVAKEVRFIRRNTSQIMKNASVIYKQKNSGKENIGYLRNTLDFHALEKHHDAFVESYGG